MSRPSDAMSIRFLFTGFDGVFHPISDAECCQRHLSIEEQIRRGRLFRWTYDLAELLEPYSDVQVVVHSNWRRLHSELRIRELLGPLRGRCAGIIPPEFDRVEGITSFVRGNGVSDFRVLDAHPHCFPPELSELIACNPEDGVFREDIQAQIRMWLNNERNDSLER